MDSTFLQNESSSVRTSCTRFYFSQAIEDVYFPAYTGSKESMEGFAKGGRVGMQEGGMAANPNIRETASFADIQLTFQEQ